MNGRTPFGPAASHTGGHMPAADHTSRTSTDGLSRVPYLPGLDGLRAIAVVAVMI